MRQGNCIMLTVCYSALEKLISIVKVNKKQIDTHNFVLNELNYLKEGNNDKF